MDSYAHSRAAAVRATSAPASEPWAETSKHVPLLLSCCLEHQRQGGNRMRRPQPCTKSPLGAGRVRVAVSIALKAFSHPSVSLLRGQPEHRDPDRSLRRLQPQAQTRGNGKACPAFREDIPAPHASSSKCINSSACKRSAKPRLILWLHCQFVLLQVHEQAEAVHNLEAKPRLDPGSAFCSGSW